MARLFCELAQRLPLPLEEGWGEGLTHVQENPPLINFPRTRFTERKVLHLTQAGPHPCPLPTGEAGTVKGSFPPRVSFS
jgi:hypothetical protein